VRAYGHDVLDLLLPRRCSVCARVGSDLCGECLDELRPIAPPLCERCGLPTAWPVARCRECAGRRLAFASARSAAVYDEAVRALVAAWKERGLRRVADVAAELVLAAVAAPDGVLTFVPPDPDRGLRRGHHPPRALAEALAAAWALPLQELLRRRPGRRQRGLSRADRRSNVRGAFVAARAPRRLVLVDDVYTSGATANAAASALRRAGARRVEVVTFARVVR
jgi:predicted amidophosphoribosyltransferase